MNNLPAGAQLLAIARDTLLAELLPLLDGEHRYAALMIANAMAIAAREIEAGDSDAAAALARLDALQGRAARALHGDALREALRTAERALAREIRSGSYDAGGPRRAALLRHLRESVAARLRISNPKSISS